MKNLNGILKSRDITLPTKVHIVKAMIFPIVMYGCESQTIRKVEHWNIYAFKLWCWRRILRVSWTTRRSNQLILREINWIFIGRTNAKAEAPILWPPEAKSWLIEKDPDTGKDWRQEKGTTEDEMVGWQLTNSMDMSLSKLWEMVKGRQTWYVAVLGVAKSQDTIEQLNTTNNPYLGQEV